MLVQWTQKKTGCDVPRKYGTMEIQRLLKDYCEQLYMNKMDNLKEMDKFSDRNNLPRLNQEETENMNRPNY